MKRFRWEMSCASGELAEICLQESLADLSPLWLAEEVWRRRAEDLGLDGSSTPPLPTAAGTAYVLCANRDGRTWHLLRRGLLLPLQWKRSEASERARLPPKLVEVSQRALEVASIIAARDLTEFRLHFSDSLTRKPDLSNLPEDQVDFESAFGALLAAALGLNADVPTNPQVFVSAAWNGTLRAVDGLEEKSEIVSRWNGTQFHTPEPLRDGAAFWRCMTSREGPVSTFAPLLASMYVDPVASRSCEELRDPELLHAALVHHRTLERLGARKEAQDYYNSRLVEPLAVNCRLRSLVDPTLEKLQGCTLVSILSRPETIRFAMETLRPHHMVVFHTDDARGSKKLLEGKRIITAWAQSMSIPPPSFFTIPDDENDQQYLSHLAVAFRRGLAEVRSKVDRSKLVYDATGGRVSMKFVMSFQVLESEDWMVACDSKSGSTPQEILHDKLRFRILPRKPVLA